MRAQNIGLLSTTLCLFLSFADSGIAGASETPEATTPKAFVATNQYASQEIEGWTVLVNKHLLTDQAKLGESALELLKTKLHEITEVVPASACAKLKAVPIWLGIHDGYAPCSEYHPSKEWLTKNGFNPDKAKCMEIGNAGLFLKWSKDQPMMVLHELAHAYQDRVLGGRNPSIEAAYNHAKQTGLYQSVQYVNGSKRRAYALTNDREYFAECSEAFFGRNDFYPFTRSELEQYDPQMYSLLTKVWMQ